MCRSRFIAMVMIHFSLPARQKPENPEKVDVVGGLLLALTLGLATWGLYNPAPDGKEVLPEQRRACCSSARWSRPWRSSCGNGSQKPG